MASSARAPCGRVTSAWPSEGDEGGPVFHDVSSLVKNIGLPHVSLLHSVAQTLVGGRVPPCSYVERQGLWAG